MRDLRSDYLRFENFLLMWDVFSFRKTEFDPAFCALRIPVRILRWPSLLWIVFYVASLVFLTASLTEVDSILAFFAPASLLLIPAAFLQGWFLHTRLRAMPQFLEELNLSHLSTSHIGPLILLNSLRDWLRLFLVGFVVETILLISIFFYNVSEISLFSSFSFFVAYIFMVPTALCFLMRTCACATCLTLPLVDRHDNAMRRLMRLAIVFFVIYPLFTIVMVVAIILSLMIQANLPGAMYDAQLRVVVMMGPASVLLIFVQGLFLRLLQRRFTKKLETSLTSDSS